MYPATEPTIKHSPDSLYSIMMWAVLFLVFLVLLCAFHGSYSNAPFFLVAYLHALLASEVPSSKLWSLMGH